MPHTTYLIYTVIRVGANVFTVTLPSSSTHPTAENARKFRSETKINEGGNAGRRTPIGEKQVDTNNKPIEENTV